jgi:hypothetical protein
LRSDFVSTKDRIAFIKEATLFGEIYILYVSGAPLLNPITPSLKYDLEELVPISKFHANSIEKEMNNMVGYAQITDITEEVLIRLELSS